MKRAVVLGVAFGAAAVAALGGYALTRPDPSQAVADGCPRDLAAILRRESPTWVYVNDRNAPATGPPPPTQWASGVVDAAVQPYLGAHPAGSDDPVSHDAYDFNVNVRADAGSAYLIGSGNDSGEGEETGRLHIERETAALPSFVWPEPGDRVSIRGSWVWDCGHWQPAGERTELHPYRALLVTRRVSARSLWGETEGDVYVSTEPTPAGVIADCAHATKGDREAFKRCLLTQPRWQDATGTYTIDLPLPAKPEGAGQPQLRVADTGSSTTPQLRTVRTATGYRVSFDLATPAGKRAIVAFQLFAGWTQTPATALPQHLRLRFRSLLVRRAMDPGCRNGSIGCVSVESTLDGQISKAPGEWNLYWDVAGIWGTWPPTVLSVHDGQVVPGRQTVDFYVPRNARWRVLTFARECDFGSLSFSDRTRPPAPCPRSSELGNPTSDDIPGITLSSFSSAAAGLGLHSAEPLAETSTCPKSNRHGCYAVSYVVTRVNDARQRAASQPRG